MHRGSTSWETAAGNVPFHVRQHLNGLVYTNVGMAKINSIRSLNWIPLSAAIHALNDQCEVPTMLGWLYVLQKTFCI